MIPPLLIAVMEGEGGGSPPSPPPPPPITWETDLAHFFHLNETVEDFSDHAGSASLVSSTYSQGTQTPGQGVGDHTFGADCTGRYLLGATSATQTGSGDRTLMFRFRTPSDLSTYSGLVCFGGVASFNTSLIPAGLLGNPNTCIGVGQASTAFYVLGDTDIQPNTVYTVLAIVSNGTLTLYVNGNVDGTADVSSIITDTGYLWIGLDGFGGVATGSSTFNDVGIWNRAFTSDKIDSIFDDDADPIWGVEFSYNDAGGGLIQFANQVKPKGNITAYSWEKTPIGATEWVPFDSDPTGEAPNETFTQGTWGVRLTVTDDGIGDTTLTKLDYIYVTADGVPADATTPVALEYSPNDGSQGGACISYNVPDGSDDVVCYYYSANANSNEGEGPVSLGLSGFALLSVPLSFDAETGFEIAGVNSNGEGRRSPRSNLVAVPGSYATIAIDVGEVGDSTLVLSTDGSSPSAYITTYEWDTDTGTIDDPTVTEIYLSDLDVDGVANVVVYFKNALGYIFASASLQITISDGGVAEVWLTDSNGSTSQLL